MLELDVDDSEPPAIGLASPDVTWDEVTDHVKIVHNPVLVGPDADGQYAGAYWTGTSTAVEDDLGADQDEALAEFRSLLRDRGDL